MELAGMPLDTHELRQHKHAINTRLHAIQTQAEALLHSPINLASAQQVSEALHVTLRLPKPVQVSVRAAFRAPPSHVLIAADYKQLEMRLMAQLSADPRLQACLNDNGRDFFVQV
ncbi:hypothetical protein Ctob_015779 [Chrysochromulina tobinii]|uniref:DNA-directed DNA polymerase family A palm domain-containing protein n=1 Tax=Chrysochromulina tobinii TaxID=1460289 RepID=A0A0M0K8Q1_9EUKA|nr:hypothetical protein Ctob_015779 [Chrysochromulina tobinii]|eukprot:KOO34947.1 hypothetical protein Ctob_015779 [Chrysochromulina sp. CCMP291]